MADNIASIRIRILGGIKAALDTRNVARAVDSLKDEVAFLALAAQLAARRLRKLRNAMLQTQAAAAGLTFGFRRLGVSLTATSIIAWSLASLALPALAVALWHVAGATLFVAAALTGALIGAFAAAALMGVAVVGRFKQMSEVIGSAANELSNAGSLVRGAFRDATASGADALMRGLASGLTKLAPLLRSLESSFTALGKAFGTMFDRLFGEIATMGPELREMFRRLTPVIESSGVMLGSLLRLLVKVATVGAPLLADAFDWLARKMDGWADAFTDGRAQKALGTIRSFIDGAKRFGRAFAEPLRGVIGPALDDFRAAWAESGDEFARTLGKIVAGFVQFGRSILPMVQSALRLVSGALGENGNRVAALLTAIVALSAVLKTMTALAIIGKGAIIGFKIAIGLLNGALWLLSAHPLVALLVAIVAVGAAFYTAYQKVKLFRDAVNEIGSQIGVGPTAAKNPGAGQRVGQGAWRGVLKGAIPILGPAIDQIGGHAGGGTMTQGGWTKVGERGEEMVHLPKASTVFTAAESRAIASHDRPRAAAPSAPSMASVNWTLVLPDMRQIASGVKEIDLTTAALEG